MTGSFDPRYGRLGWELIHAGWRLGARGLVAGAEGNLSRRLDDGSLLITAAGARKDELQPTDLLVLRADGSVARGERQPSTELALHLAAYELSPESRAVIHAHPIAATAFAAAERLPTWTALAESIAILSPVRLVDFASPGTDEMGSALLRAGRHGYVFLLAHHGALTVGASLDEALQRMELLERLCQVECAAANIGGLRPLPEVEQAGLRGD